MDKKYSEKYFFDPNPNNKFIVFVLHMRINSINNFKLN